jgi:predicted choloylglycine hydrolase
MLAEPRAPGRSISLKLTFASLEEARPGPKWQALFQLHWDAYRRWFLSEGPRARPPYYTSRKQLATHMPELVSTYDTLAELAGGGDLAARFLSLYRPPPYLTGCSQAIWGGPHPLLARNYDYAAQLCEAMVLKTTWNGRSVIGQSDCLWGILDGMSDAGLAVSLSFGGSRKVGEGFGVPVLLRYVLEFCNSTAEACQVLARLPSHMAYNVAVVDSSGDYRTVFLAPGRRGDVRKVAVSTNHQDTIEWHDHARATRTLERERHLYQRLRDPAAAPARLVRAFLLPPVYSNAYSRGYGTLYTAVYRPASGQVEYLWPDLSWRQSFAEFREERLVINYPNVADDTERLH